VLFIDASVSGAMTSTPGDVSTDRLGDGGHVLRLAGPEPNDSKEIRDPSGDTTVRVVPRT
jgi:hypothetical protein